MLPGKRRSKAVRAQLRPAHHIPVGQARAALRRERLTRLVVVFAAILATAAIVHGNGPAFTYRLGQRPARQVRATEDFRRRNPIQTNTAREDAAAKVPPLMVNDPAPIKELDSRLDDLVDSASHAPDLEAMRETLGANWTPDPATFALLKSVANSPAKRADLHRRIDLAFEPLIRYGILGPDTLPRQEESGSYLRIRSFDEGPDQAVLLSRESVRPGHIAKPEGQIAKDFAAIFDPPKLGVALFNLVAPKLAGTPTLRFEEQATRQARQLAKDQVEDKYDTYRKGDLLVDQDQEIAEEHLALLRLEHQETARHLGWGARIRRIGSVVVLVAALFALVGYYVHRHEPQIARSTRQTAVLCGLVVGAVGIGRLLAMQPLGAELIPVALVAMVLAIAYNPHFALMVTFTLSLLTSMALGGGIGQFLVLMGGTAAGVLTLNEVRTRTKPIKVGATAALGYLLLTGATGLWQNQPTPLILADGLWRGGWGLMTGFLLGGILPLIEAAFGIVTGISLLELGDVTHPLLQELIRRAPGTHNHSITVGTIAEAAAERIGANALLIRIGAYFHDIGKMLKPHYFIENQAGAANRHANLNPAMSTLIIIGHVKDGVDLGRQHHLPESIIDLIEQHHGTTLVEYFYREAARRSSGDPDASLVQESSFRYPGPKPQTKEAGILMVSDAVESASRTLSEPTPARIEGLVRELIDKRLDDGQFDECGLTLREIGEIRESLIKSLIGIYHGRVKYPEQRTA